LPGVMKVESWTKPQHFCCVSDRPDGGSPRRSVRPDPTTELVNVTIGGMMVLSKFNVRREMLERWSRLIDKALQGWDDALTAGTPSLEL
jgi:hypothetical protein